MIKLMLKFHLVELLIYDLSKNLENILFYRHFDVYNKLIIAYIIVYVLYMQITSYREEAAKLARRLNWRTLFFRK